MLVGKLRKTGNSYVVTVPKEVMDRQNLHEGDYVALEIRKADYQIQMDPDVRAAFERSMALYKDDYDYLGEN